MLQTGSNDVSLEIISPQDWLRALNSRNSLREKSIILPFDVTGCFEKLAINSPHFF